MHVLSDANGLPLVVGVSAANTHDSEGLKPMVAGHQTRHDPHRGHYFKPERLHADKAYDRPDLRKWLRGKRIGVRIARKGIESSERLGRRRWVIERTMSWLSGYRRLSPRYERDPRNYLALPNSPQPSAATSDSFASPRRTRSKYFGDKERLLLAVLEERVPGLSRVSVRPGEGDIEENLAELAHAVLDFYQRSIPMLGALLADPERMAAHRVAMSRHGGGPEKAVSGFASYPRAEQDLERIAGDADPDSSAALPSARASRRRSCATTPRARTPTPPPAPTPRPSPGRLSDRCCNPNHRHRRFGSATRSGWRHQSRQSIPPWTTAVTTHCPVLPARSAA
jgi:transposase